MCAFQLLVKRTCAEYRFHSDVFGERTFFFLATSFSRNLVPSQGIKKNNAVVLTPHTKNVHLQITSIDKGQEKTSSVKDGCMNDFWTITSKLRSFFLY